MNVHDKTWATLLLVKMLDELRPESRRNARGMILGVRVVSTTVLALTGVGGFSMFSGDMGDDLLQNTQRSLHEFRGPCSHLNCVVQRSLQFSPTATWSPRARECRISAGLVSDLKIYPSRWSCLHCGFAANYLQCRQCHLQQNDP